ncbi:hypothetical protein BH23ACT10_BH23ACT10_03280 [soil metagenome]
MPAVGVALAFGVAAAVWIAAGDLLPGGRWLAVHLFTLGVLTNVIVAFTQHFGQTVTRADTRDWRWQPPVLNVGVALVLIGVTTGAIWAIAGGATIATAVVFVSYLRLRRMRRQSVGARFAWIARIYERAHGSFIHGAILGLLLGIGALPGSWYGAGRVAHLHVNVLGWAGLTLLATVVFFGPTMLRTRIEHGADARAAEALRHGATALTIAVFLLLATGVGGYPGTVLRVLAAAALGVYAWAATIVCLPVLRAARAAKPTAARPPLIALCAWFPALVWADVAIVASGQLQLLDALGVAALAGVLAQAVATALSYIAPAVRGHSTADRSLLIARLTRGAATRTIVYNLGVAALVLAAADVTTRATVATGLTAAGWVFAIGALGTQVAVVAWPVTTARR